MVARAKGMRFRVRFSDKRSYRRMRAILAFESEKRGRSTGQTLYDLVMKAVDIDSYPEEVRARIDELEMQAEREAVEKALEMSREDE